MDTLRQTLKRIDGRGYRAYKDIQGTYRAGEMELRLDHVQGDPFADPSRLALRVPLDRTWITPALVETRQRRIAMGDLLTRIFHWALDGGDQRGSGGSGRLTVDAPGQEILARSSCVVSQDAVELRFKAGLPAAGRRVLGREAWKMLGEDVPTAATRTLAPGLDFGDRARRQVEAVEDADAARAALQGAGLVAFVAEGAILPRRSGVDPRPMTRGAIPFGPIPESLRVELDLPHRGRVTGLGIPAGVTLVVGGGYHGKSTLLAALALGVYNHVPGDGRELVVTDPRAVAIRAEDGRRVEGLDISPFIRELPGGRSTASFFTDDASGSTSQAANIMEALEMGAGTLLIDEDTSANNFMIRDHRMQRLVAQEHEPIVPFIDQVRGLYERRGVSTLLVLGGSGDYFDVADRVIQMQDYRPRDVTAQAKAICEELPSGRIREGDFEALDPAPRQVMACSFDPSKGRRAERVRSLETRAILFGEEEIELTAVEQLVTGSQTRFIADILLHIHRHLADGRQDLPALVDEALEAFAAGGFDDLTRGCFGDRAVARGFEVAAAINRLRTLTVERED